MLNTFWVSRKQISKSSPRKKGERASPQMLPLIIKINNTKKGRKTIVFFLLLLICLNVFLTSRKRKLKNFSSIKEGGLYPYYPPGKSPHIKYIYIKKNKTEISWKKLTFFKFLVKYSLSLQKTKTTKFPSLNREIPLKCPPSPELKK